MLGRGLANVRFGSIADMTGRICDVCFTPKSGHCRTTVRCPLCAKSRHSALRQRLALFDDLIGGNVQCLIGWRVRQLERIGNGTTRDLAIVHIETITQMQVIVERPPPSLVGEREDK
jgi:hypothetical protein